MKSSASIDTTGGEVDGGGIIDIYGVEDVTLGTPEEELLAFNWEEIYADHGYMLREFGFPFYFPTDCSCTSSSD